MRSRPGPGPGQGDGSRDQARNQATVLQLRLQRAYGIILHHPNVQSIGTFVILPISCKCVANGTCYREISRLFVRVDIRVDGSLSRHYRLLTSPRERAARTCTSTPCGCDVPGLPFPCCLVSVCSKTKHQ